ncbi:MAG: hypothetical protein NVSMB63_06640 [Sediminibacterium sp.]
MRVLSASAGRPANNKVEEEPRVWMNFLLVVGMHVIFGVGPIYKNIRLFTIFIVYDISGTLLA